MNLKHWTGLFCAATALLTAGCSEDKYSPATDTGTIALALDVDRGVLTANPSRASLAEICEGLTAADFTIRLTDDKGESREWPYSSFTGENIKIGTYTIEAYSGNEGEEGFDKAYFLGSSKVTVTTDNTTDVAVTAALANAAVKVVYTDAFKHYMTSYSASVRTAGASEGIAYGPNDTDELFINPGEASLYVTFTTPQGKTATLKAADFTSVARHSYTVTVDVNGGQIGDAVLTVTFDDTTASENVEIVLSDELLNMPAPTVSAGSASIDVIEGSSADAHFDVIAPGAVDGLVLTTVSEPLLAQGWPAEIDLAKATEAQIAELKGKGLKLRLAKEMAVVDLSAAIASIRVTDDATQTTVFRLEATDTYGKVSDPAAELTVNVSPLRLGVVGNGIFMAGDTEATLQVEYNGANLANEVSFEAYYSDRAVWEAAPIVSAVKKSASRADELYDVTIKVPGGSGDVKVRANVANVISVDYTITRGIPEFALSNVDIDNFATRATVTLTSDDANPATIAKDATYTVTLADGTPVSGVSATVDGNRITLANLPTGQHLNVKAEFVTNSASVAVTTEQALQIPNGNLDADVTINGSKSNWENVVFNGWGTNNPMTTWFSETPMLSNYAYDKISGTKQPSDAHSGKAARISTQGWGSGNTATGPNGSDGKCKYIDAGLLHLGSSRTKRPEGFTDLSGSLNTDDLDCGIAFGSRPSSLNFWYKYEAKNSADHGVAKAYVYDAAGKIIAQGSLELGSQGSYVERSIPLTYAAGAAKAAKIYICFMSTNVPTALTRDNSWLGGPGFGGNGGKGEFYGSRLYIDDVTLNY